MKLRKAISLLAALCFCAVLCCTSAFASYYSDVITLRPDYKGVTEGVLKGTDYLRNTHITDDDLDADYEPWMAAAVGDYFTEEYFHQYQVYYKCVNAGIIKEGDDLDLSLIIKSGSSTGADTPSEPQRTVVAMDSSLIQIPENYAGSTSGYLTAADYAKIDGLDYSQDYASWMKMEYGSQFTEAFYHEYQVYWRSVDAGIVAAGEDLDLGLVLDTMIYSDGTSELTPQAQEAQAQKEYEELEARYSAMRVPSIIICAILMVVILAATIVWLFLDSNRRYKAYLARGGADAETKEEPASPVMKKQVVVIDLFGNQVSATVLRDEAATVFSFSYNLGENHVEASGEIQDGQYVVTEDPAGVGKMVIKNIVSKLTDEWE